MVVSFKVGLPNAEEAGKCWEGEHLTTVLKRVNIPLVLPGAKEAISGAAYGDDGSLYGLYKSNPISIYWNHVDQVDPSDENVDTQTFVKIHRMAVEAERAHLKKLGEAEGKSYHITGIAVPTRQRAHGMGQLILTKQLETFRGLGGTTVFCETTSSRAVGPLTAFGFEKITEFSYAELAKTLGDSRLALLNGSFSVWCLKL